MSLPELLRIATPPASVMAVTDDRWPVLEKSLGTRLPADYRAYVNTFGLGVLGRFQPYIPDSCLPGLDLLQASKEVIQHYKDLLANESPVASCPLFPEEGGLFPWGQTTQGYDLFWLTEGRPDGWVVVVASGFPDLETIRYPLSMTSFMADILSSKLHCPLIDPIEPASSARFIPSPC